MLKEDWVIFLIVYVENITKSLSYATKEDAAKRYRKQVLERSVKQLT